MQPRTVIILGLCIVAGCGGRTRVRLEGESEPFGFGGSGSGARSGGDTGSGGSGGLNGVGGVGPSGGAGGVFGIGGLFGSGGTGGSGGSGTGGAAGCFDDADCATADACLSGECLRGTCAVSLRDRDEDGFADALCGGADCNDLNALSFPGARELCDDATDNDCNGVADCFDPACRGVSGCGCTMVPGGEVCDNGRDEDCDGAIDCNDPDCVGTTACGCDAEQCANGSDDDCDGRIDCDDPDCAGEAECACRAATEFCSNGADEDCDGAVDCSDSDCVFDAACLCLIPSAEVCGDGRDNDCDGLVDCGDPVCFSNILCASCRPEICSGGVDEDCDGRIDCADPSCAFDPLCPASIELCNNQRDDDFDGRIDCDDADCATTQVCVEKQNTCLTARRIEPLASATYVGNSSGQVSNFRGSCGGDAGEGVFRLDLFEPLGVRIDTIGTSFDSVMYVRTGDCEFGREIGCDDDSGGVAWSSALEFDVLQPGTYFIYVDGLTVDPFGGPNEGPYVLNVETLPVDEDCQDGLDNDGNGYTDCADAACATVVACAGCNSGSAAVAEYGTALCTDGIDNDCDGETDCDDEDCSASEENVTECCTGTDQNGNGIADDFSCRCVDDRDCSGRQICYSSTVRACGIRCGAFFGEICPFLAAGSSCNVATGQCEF